MARLLKLKFLILLKSNINEESILEKILSFGYFEKLKKVIS